MAGDTDAQKGAYADLGGIRILIPPSMTALLAHISKSHSSELDSLSKEFEASMEGDLAGTRMGEGISTVMAILRLSEDHLKEGKLIKGDLEEARAVLYRMAFGLLRGLARERSD